MSVLNGLKVVAATSPAKLTPTDGLFDVTPLLVVSPPSGGAPKSVGVYLTPAICPLNLPLCISPIVIGLAGLPSLDVLLPARTPSTYKAKSDVLLVVSLT